MESFAIAQVFAPTVAIFLFTLVVSYYVTQWPVLSIGIALIKASLFCIYFTVFFDGTYTFLDDITYLEGSKILLAKGVGITNLFENWSLVKQLAGSWHVAYYIYNTYAFRIFGIGYFAPVACNVMLTVCVAYCGYQIILRGLSVTKKTAKVFFVFLLLHPTILAWSSILNGKDTLVLLLHAFLLISIYHFFQRNFFYCICIALPVFFVLFYLRFYVPALFVVALFASCLLTINTRNAHYSVLVCIGGLLVLAWVLVFAWVDGIIPAVAYVVAEIQSSMQNIAYNIVRFVLTPVIFNADPAYAFLNVPSLIYWLLFPLAIFGAWHVWKLGTPFAAFFIAYAAVFIVFYAIFTEVQGPRHRYQLACVLAIFQFYGAMKVFSDISVRIGSRITKPLFPV